jgi:hypothetical protein
MQFCWVGDLEFAVSSFATSILIFSQHVRTCFVSFYWNFLWDVAFFKKKSLPRFLAYQSVCHECTISFHDVVFAWFHSALMPMALKQPWAGVVSTVANILHDRVVVSDVRHGPISFFRNFVIGTICVRVQGCCTSRQRIQYKFKQEMWVFMNSLCDVFVTSFWRQCDITLYLSKNSEFRQIFACFAWPSFTDYIGIILETNASRNDREIWVFMNEFCEVAVMSQWHHTALWVQSPNFIKFSIVLRGSTFAESIGSKLGKNASRKYRFWDHFSGCNVTVTLQ